MYSGPSLVFVELSHALPDNLYNQSCEQKWNVNYKRLAKDGYKL